MFCKKCGKKIDNIKKAHIVNITSGTIKYGEELYCEDCLKKYTKRCKVCGEYFLENSFIADEDICINCAYYRVINIYQYKPSNIYHGFNMAGRYVGMELEVSFLATDDITVEKQRAGVLLELAKIIKKNNYKNLYLKSDSSLHLGFEIVTHPYSYESFKKIKLNKYLNLLKENNLYSAKKSNAGLHFHFSNEWLIDKSLNLEQQDTVYKRAIALLILFTNEQKVFIESISRRKDFYYCEPFILSGNNLYERYNSALRLTEQRKKLPRFKMINFTNKNTVEFRLFQGTLDYDIIIKDMEFCHTILQKVLELSTLSLKIKQCGDVEKWFKKIQQEFKKITQEFK